MDFLSFMTKLFRNIKISFFAPSSTLCTNYSMTIYYIIIYLLTYLLTRVLKSQQIQVSMLLLSKNYKLSIKTKFQSMYLSGKHQKYQRDIMLIVNLIHIHAFSKKFSHALCIITKIYTKLKKQTHTKVPLTRYIVLSKHFDPFLPMFDSKDAISSSKIKII